MKRVFVTDGSYPNGLAAVRALGAAGFRVTVGEREGVPPSARIAFWSRHCAERVLYPDPRREPERALERIGEHLAEKEYAAAIPVGLDMTELFVEGRSRLNVLMLLPPVESFRIACDKPQTFAHAAAIGVPVPRTKPLAQWQELRLPIVVKHSRSGASVAATPDAVAIKLNSLNGSSHEYVAQEYVEGRNGYGYFGFFYEGREVAYFMHERLVQFPREGGPSVVARSIHDGRLRELGKTLLESLRWHGVAMVEFKRDDRDGELYLMEINPKLWGSLDLAITAGCNFPVWIARALVDGTLPSSTDYPDGVTYQWTIPNGLKSFLRYPEFRTAFARNVVSPSVKTDLRITDPMPSVAALYTMAINGVTRS